MAFVRGLLGLMLFFAGMRIMSGALRGAATERVRVWLAALSGNPLQGFLLGALTTAILQSSSLTTVLVVGLVHAAILPLPAGIAVILGANVGTTLTAHLLAIQVERLGVFIALAALTAFFLAGKHRFSFLAAAGFGILLTGLDLLTGSLAVFKDMGILEGALKAAEGSPLGGVAAGALASALIQSSSTVIAFVIALAREGAIGLAPGMYLVFGADIGTCLTSLAASGSTNRAGRRAALAHLFFNMVSAFIVLAAGPIFVGLVSATSSYLPRQIANGHTLYNLAGGLLFLPLVRQYAFLIMKLIPDK